MTREDLLDKITKLRRLARNNPNAQEAATAQRKADELASRHGVSESEMILASTSAAHDELVEELRKFAAEKMKTKGGPFSLFNAGSMIDNILQEIKKAKNEDKSSRIRKITELVRAGHLVAPTTFGPLSEIVEKVLKNHEITL